MGLAFSSQLPDVFRPFLASDQWVHVKCYFARRLDLRANEISQRLGDSYHVIRLCIAKRVDLSAEQVDRCVRDSAANVWHFIARNPLLTEGQRNRLLADPDELVCHAARKGSREESGTNRELRPLHHSF